MITLEPIGFVRSSRSDLSDDDWGTVTARIELVESLPAESPDGIEAFSHAEVVYYFYRVPDGGARHPRGNTADRGKTWYTVDCYISISSAFNRSRSYTKNSN